MNDRSHGGRAVAALLLGAALALAGCSHQPDAASAPLAGAAIGGPFTLVNQEGQPTSDHAFTGRYRIIYFGYSFCPDVCPDTLQKLMKAVAAFRSAHPDAAAKLVPIFITVDPERDTPAALKTYVNAFGTGLIGLTGSPAQIATVAKEYGVYYRKQPTKGAGGYLVDHSSVPMLFGPDGKPIEILPIDKGADAVATDLATWVQ